MKRLRRRWQELRDRLMLDTFWRLVFHFGERLFSGSGEAGEGEG